MSQSIDQYMPVVVKVQYEMLSFQCGLCVLSVSVWIVCVYWEYSV